MGFKDKEVLKLGLKNPGLYGYKKDNIQKRILNICEFGYSYEETIRMVVTFPTLLTLSIGNMKQKIEDLISLGYSYKEVIIITKKFPQIYSSSIDDIREKKEFYDFLGIGFIILLEPRRLIQSLNLSYARYMFLLSIGIHINKDNFRKLFIEQKQFIKLYNKTNEDIINQYCNINNNKRKSR